MQSFNLGEVDSDLVSDATLQVRANKWRNSLPNPFNPLDWVKSAQDWFAKTEKSSGFRPFLIYLLLCLGAGVVLLVAFPDRLFVDIIASILIVVPVLSFVPLYAWKSHRDPDFCRSETHVQRIKKYELEAMGTESKQIAGDIIEQVSIVASIKEPLFIDHGSNGGDDK